MKDKYMVITNMRGVGKTRRLFFNSTQLGSAKHEAKESFGHVYDLSLRARIF